ncbi:MAG: RDD family protein [Pseudomonadota bacterium]
MNNQNPDNLEPIVTPGFFRRLGAMLYDALLLLALIMVAVALITLPLGAPSGVAHIIYQFFLFAIIPAVFFCGFWVRGGQTLGMRAWKLKLVRADGDPVSWMDVLKRYLAALLSWLVLGLGFLWIFVDSENLAWHDRLSDTRLQLLKE